MNSGKGQKMRTGSGSSLIEYILIALVVVVAVSSAFIYVWPVMEVVLGDFKLLGEALAVTK